MDRKNSGLFGTVVVMVLFLCLHLQAQNLVPNPSFEEFSSCASGPGKIVFATPWFNVRVSCDYYHECGTNGASIPVSWGGDMQERDRPTRDLRLGA